MIKRNQRRMSIVWNGVVENHHRGSAWEHRHYPNSYLDRRYYNGGCEHYQIHRSNQYIRFCDYGSQVTHEYCHKRWDAQHCYHHSYTRNNMTSRTKPIQKIEERDASQQGAGSESRSLVDQTTLRPKHHRQPLNPSVDTETSVSSVIIASPLNQSASRRGGLVSGSSWRKPSDPLGSSQDHNTVNGFALGYQRKQRSNYRSPEHRGQSSHGWRQSSECSSKHGKYRRPSQVKTVKPSEQYMALSQEASVLLEEPVPKKLLILDLNGTLVSRTKKRDSMFVRPYQDKFVDYIFRYFDVMVWSSAQPHSVAYMCRLFEDRVNELVLKWDRTMLGLTPAQYNSKSITIKDLEKVWEVFGSKYDATNTILLDDSPIKAQLQPYNSIHLREFSHTSPSFHSHGESELLHVVRYLEKVRLQSNVCSFMRDAPFVPPDPAQDPNNENMFEVYHYVFNSEGRQLKDFRPKSEELDGEVAEVERLLESTKI